jgi:hypothetical protein
VSKSSKALIAGRNYPIIEGVVTIVRSPANPSLSMKFSCLLPCLIAATFLFTALERQVLGQAAVADPQTKQAKVEGDSTPDKSDSSASDEDQAADVASAEQSRAANEISHFLRISRDRQDRPVAMQTSVTRYWMTNEQGDRVMVDLIGVVHIGEKEYYEKFNELFQGYDTVLYELVAPEGTVIPKGGRNPDDGGMMNPIAALQKGMQTALGLEFQLEHIDYTKPNFVHADMSPEEFGESMRNNDESFSKMLLRAMGQSMALQSRGRGGDAGMLLALFSKNKTLRLRRAMAEQMQNMEGGMIMFEGKDGSTIINHRNAKAMEVLRREIESGKKKVAVFYGAGHLPDMQRRLESDFRMQRAGQFWLDAWKLTNREYNR